MTAPQRLVLVRHGESEWNVERRIQGQSGTGLSERGRAQADRTARLLADAYPDALLAGSDLQRCRETVAPLVDRLGRDCRYEVGLRERDFGRWTGVLASEVVGADPEVWERWRAGGDVVAEVGGEDSATLVDRVVTTLERLLADAGDRPVVCVTHGGPVWHGTAALLGLGDRVLGGVVNCSVTELEIAADHRRLVGWNQVTHLPLELRMVRRAVAGKEAADEDSPPVGT